MGFLFSLDSLNISQHNDNLSYNVVFAMKHQNKVAKCKINNHKKHKTNK